MVLEVKNLSANVDRYKRCRFNPPAVVKDPREEDVTTHSSILVESPMERGAW